MKKLLTIALGLSITLGTLGTLAASASATPCNDGWNSSSTGSGTCSYHGGIRVSVHPYYGQSVNILPTPDGMVAMPSNLEAMKVAYGGYDTNDGTGVYFSPVTFATDGTWGCSLYIDGICFQMNHHAGARVLDAKRGWGYLTDDIAATTKCARDPYTSPQFNAKGQHICTEWVNKPLRPYPYGYRHAADGTVLSATNVVAA